MTERMEIDPLRQATLLDGCRHAMRDDRTFSRWISRRRAELLELLRTAREQDPALYLRLRGDEAIRETLSDLIPPMWRDGRPQPDVDAMDGLVEWMLSGSPLRLTPRFGQLVSDLLSSNNVGPARAECYNLLVDRVRPTFGGQLSMDMRREGWVFLLADAAKANHRDESAEIAHKLAGEAWACRNYLSPGTPETAKTLSHLASLFGASVGNLKTRQLGEEDFDQAFAIIDEAEESITAIEDPIEVAKAAAGLGIARSQLWYVRKRRGLTGTVTAEERRVEVLTAAEDAVRRFVAPSAEGDYSALPAALRLVTTRLLGDLAGAAKFTGDSELAQRAARDASVLNDRPHQRLNLLLTTARSHNSVKERLRCDEAVLREIDAGALAGLNDWQRERFQNRLKQECVDLARDLRKTQMNTAAWFWERQRQEWSTKSAELSSSGTSERSVAQVTVPAAPAAPIPWPENVERCLREENVAGLVICLMKAATGLREKVSVLSAVLARVDDWRPPARCAVEDRMLPDQCVTHSDIEIAALQLAAEFSEAYVTFMGPQVRIWLARLKRLPSGRRREWAQRTFDLAEKTERWGHALDAQDILIELACDGADSGVETYVAAFQGIVRRWLVSATGAADLIDVSKEITKRCTRTAAKLADSGYARLAFELARSAVGLVGRMISEDPQLAVEFELVERRSGTPEPIVEDQLYGLMRDRITGRKRVVIPEVCTMDEISSGYGRSVSFVQMLASAERGCWAIGQSRVGDDVNHWAVQLGLTAAELGELRAVVWTHLRPARDGRANQGLEGLYRDVVRHLEPAINTIEEIVFVPRAGFAGLPLHAAHSPEGYLIERHRVTYLANLDARKAGRTVRPDGLVAGWNPQIGAGEEAKDLAERLATLGMTISRPPKATEGRKMLLDSDRAWGVVHIAAHGYFFAWPHSMDSRLELSTKVAVTARDWLHSGCRAQFVFINACSVGRQSLHAGDLNGFPLAFRVRGAVTEVSALAPVRGTAAHQFARVFYQRWACEDSLKAYHAACVEAIRLGWNASDWAPYLHAGAPAVLASKEFPGEANRLPADSVVSSDATPRTPGAQSSKECDQ